MKLTTALEILMVNLFFRCGLRSILALEADFHQKGQTLQILNRSSFISETNYSKTTSDALS